MIAFVFPGQGSQAVGMGRDLAEVFPEARAVFDEADTVLGEDLSRLCFEGPEEALRLTENTQPAILTVSVAALRVLEAAGVRPDWVAGHSLGEYSAVVAAGGLSLGDALVTVRRRGTYMQAAVPVGQGAMAAILLLDAAQVAEACAQAAQGEVVAPANLNAPGQTVIAGHAAAVERAMQACLERGARQAKLLPVSAPFHCELMRPAQERLAPDLLALGFRDLRVPLMNNVDAAPARAAQDVRDGLRRQVSGAVRWQESIERLRDAGVTTFVEIGPGKVLSGLVTRILGRQTRVANVSDAASLEATLKALRGAAQEEPSGGTARM